MQQIRLEWKQRSVNVYFHTHFTIKNVVFQGLCDGTERGFYMNELERKAGAGIAVLDDLAAEARYYCESAARNMLNLGRVLIEARPLVEHGKWGDWVHDNVGISKRSADQFMQAYTRFGNDEKYNALDKSKLFKMLSLPPGTEEDFMEENDLASMSAREVEKAVRRVREEMQVELDKEKERRKSAESRVNELENSDPVIPEYVSDSLREKNNEIEGLRAEVDRLANIGQESLNAVNQLRRENATLKKDVQERDDLLKETQEECDRAQAELLNMQSAAAKGDAERIPSDELTIDVFAGAVRQFIGTCARMPHMQKTFALMDFATRNAYDEHLRAVESLVQASRKALDTLEGVLVDG